MRLSYFKRKSLRISIANVFKDVFKIIYKNIYYNHKLRFLKTNKRNLIDCQFVFLKRDFNFWYFDYIMCFQRRFRWSFYFVFKLNVKEILTTFDYKGDLDLFFRHGGGFLGNIFLFFRKVLYFSLKQLHLQKICCFLVTKQKI